MSHGRIGREEVLRSHARMYSAENTTTSTQLTMAEQESCTVNEEEKPAVQPS